MSDVTELPKTVVDAIIEEAMSLIEGCHEWHSMHLLTEARAAGIPAVEYGEAEKANQDCYYGVLGLTAGTVALIELAVAHWLTSGHWAGILQEESYSRDEYRLAQANLPLAAKLAKVPLRNIDRKVEELNQQDRENARLVWRDRLS